MNPTVTIQLARSAQEYESAFRLLQRTRETWGFDPPETRDLWLLKHHALPSTNTIVAMQAGQVIGAICLFGESPFQLPVESRLNLGAFQQNLEGRLAELSLPGLHPDYAGNRDVLFALFHFAVCFGTSYCHYDGLVTESPLPWAKEFAPALQYERIYEPVEGRQLLFLNLRAGTPDFRASINKGFLAEYRFPEKKFFLVAHQSMQPPVLEYLFNQRTHLFSTLTDSELRVLRNIYDWGEYAKLLPERSPQHSPKKTPRFPRFPMNCDGFLVNAKGGSEHVQLLDVSREGLKIRTQNPPDIGESRVLTLFIGVNKKTELIASAIWVDEKSGMAGLELRSNDTNWQQLIEYLEKDFLRVA